MRTVYKYPLEGEVNTIPLPDGAKVVSVGEDPNHVVCVWIELYETGQVKRDRTFRWYGTGHPIPDQATHCGSIVTGPLVLHLYEVV